MRAQRRARLAHAQLHLQGVLQIVDIGGGAFIQYHQIDGQLLHAPVFVRPQQLARDRDVLNGFDQQQHDRDVAGNAERP